uniref:Secreted protein n=1 Tax=Anopheles minimus TaxID=112268 RepID=A0A182WNK7_9DIPT
MRVAVCGWLWIVRLESSAPGAVWVSRTACPQRKGQRRRRPQRRRPPPPQPLAPSQRADTTNKRKHPDDQEGM